MRPDFILGPDRVYRFYGQPLPEMSDSFTYDKLNDTFIFSTDIGLKVATLKRVFYVIQPTGDCYYTSVSRNGNGFLQFSSHNLTVDHATQFTSASEAFKTIAERKSHLSYAVVRVERTVVPGKVIPAKETRTIVTGAPEYTDKWALMSPESRIGSGLERFYGTILGDPIHNLQGAKLYDTSVDLVKAIASMSPVLLGVGFGPGIENNGANIVRVRVTQSPEVREKDTVTDVLTVLE